MEIKKDKMLTHLCFGSYTIGFVVGSLVFFISEINKDFQIKFSVDTIICFLLISPVFYWTYRYFGMVFDNQSLKVKLPSFLLMLIGFCSGVIFFEIIVNKN